jgi:hypothetical protein
MKVIFCCAIFLSAPCFLNAQSIKNSMPVRRIQFHTIGKDSIDLPLNEDYDLIEDSCSQITRYAHINMRERKFFGAFKDASKLDPAVVLSEGNYTADGLKDGLFTSHYMNGNLRSKGHYKNNTYEGRWEAYYDNDKPSILFEASNDTIRILDAWDAAGKKTVENGKGTYKVTISPISWKGKLENGRPDGTWHTYKTDDATETAMVDEYFKKGKFQSGNSPVGKYTDASRILLINSEIFPFNRTERLRASIVPCNGIKRKHLVNAQYDNGLSSFSQFIELAITPYISNYNIRNFHDQLTITGVISVDGRIIKLIPVLPNPFSEPFTRGLINQFFKVPALQPATADGKPIEQKFSITFVFETGMYHYSYKFLAIDRASLK